MAQLFQVEPRPDGVFCYNDLLAIGAMDYAIEQGLRIPEDVAIIGCGNLHYDDSVSSWPFQHRSAQPSHR